MKEIEPIKEAWFMYEQLKMKLLDDIHRLESKFDLNCSFINNEIDTLKEPLQFQIQDIKQEKDVILRELEKVYQNNRELIIENLSLKDVDSAHKDLRTVITNTA